VVDDCDGLCGEDGPWDWLSLREARGCNEQTERERRYPSMFHKSPRETSDGKRSSGGIWL